MTDLLALTDRNVVSYFLTYSIVPKYSTLVGDRTLENHSGVTEVMPHLRWVLSRSLAGRKVVSACQCWTYGGAGPAGGWGRRADMGVNIDRRGPAYDRVLVAT